MINNYAFFGCNSLSSINIPLNVIKIGDYAFSNCSRLGELTLSSALKELSSTAFIGSSAILNIPDEDSQTALTLIDQEIVYTTDNPGIKDREDKNLNMQKSTYLPAYNSVTSSGVVNLSVKYSFKNTVRLLVSDVQIKIRIPSSVTYIDNTAKVNGAIASTVLQDNFLIISLENKSEGNITFSVRPNDSKFLMSYALISYRINNNIRTETVGIVNLATKFLTLEIPDETANKTVNVHGLTMPGETVYVYVNGNDYGACVASKTGSYSKTIELPDRQNKKMYKIEVKIQNEDKSEQSAFDYITYNEQTVKMTSCVMYYNGNAYDMMGISGKGPVITWTGGLFSFKVAFENCSIIDNLYIVSTRSNEEKTIKAIYDAKEDVFVATGFSDYMPGTISVRYVANEKEVVIDSSFNFLAELFENLPEEYKDSEVIINKNTYSEETASGEIEAEVTIDEISEEPVKISAKINNIDGVPRYEDGSVVDEQSLSQRGYSKVKRTNEEYSYVKYEVSKDKKSATIKTWDFDRFGNTVKETSVEFVADTTFDLAMDVLDMSSIGTVISTAYDVYDIYNQKDVNEAIRKINNSNLPLAEKNRRIEEIRSLGYKQQTLKYLKLTASLVTGLAIGVLGGPFAAPLLLATGFITNGIFNYFDNTLVDMMNGYSNDLIDVNFRFACDPSGVVFEAVFSNRITGVKTTAYFKMNESDSETFWDASEYEQINPLYTDVNGAYAWDVPDGLWQVKYEKDGYETAYSEWLPVPPPQLDVNVGLKSTEAPVIDLIEVTTASAKVRFSQYVDIESLTSETITISQSGKAITGVISPVDAEVSADNSDIQYATTFIIQFDEELDSKTEVEIKVTGVENYCGTKMKKEFSASIPVSFELASLSVQKAFSALYGEKKELVVKAEPAEAVVGKKLIVTSSNDYILAPIPELVFDKTGIAKIPISSKLPGDVELKVSVDGMIESASTLVKILTEEEPHEHDFNELRFDSENHWYECDCGEKEDVDAHEWNDGVVTAEASCEIDGVKTYTCSICNATKTERISATGHDFGAWTELDENVHQRICAIDASHVETDEHDWNQGEITKPATCETDGEKTVTCIVCGATRQEQIPATGHAFGEWKELNENEHQRICANDPSHIETAAHTWNKGKVTTKATCDTDGVKTYTCTVCKATRQESIPATGHAFGEWKELNENEHQRICANDPSHVETAAHTWNKGKVTTAATCETDGVKTYTCTACKATRQESIPATGHAFGDWKELNEKEHQRVCANDPSHVETVAHNWDKGKITKEPAPGVEGEKQFVCKDCGAVKTEPIEALPVETDAPTTEAPTTEAPTTEAPTTEAPTTETPTTEAPTTAEPTQYYTLGDVNMDGKINSADARLALRAAAKVETLTEVQNALADVTGDGKVKAADARTILRIAARLEPKPDKQIPAAA